MHFRMLKYVSKHPWECWFNTVEGFNLKHKKNFEIYISSIKRRIDPTFNRWKWNNVSLHRWYLSIFNRIWCSRKVFKLMPRANIDLGKYSSYWLRMPSRFQFESHESEYNCVWKWCITWPWETVTWHWRIWLLQWSWFSKLCASRCFHCRIAKGWKSSLSYCFN